MADTEIWRHDTRVRSSGRLAAARAAIRWPIAVATFALATVAAPQRTWRVPGDAPAINDAIRQARPGDRILLTAAAYGSGSDRYGITIDKGVTIEPRPGRRAAFTMNKHTPHGLRVTRLGGKRFLLRNFDIAGDPRSGFDDSRRHVCLEIRLHADDTGAIVLDGVTARGLLSNIDRACPGLVASTGPGVDVTIRGCEFRGSTGNVPWILTDESGFEGSPGAVLDVEGTAVIQDTVFAGGDGATATWRRIPPPARDGGEGVSLRAPHCAVVGGEIIDGNGGDVDARRYMFKVPLPCTRVGRAGTSLLPHDPFDVKWRRGRQGMSIRCPTRRPPPRMLGENRRDLRVDATQQRLGVPFTLFARGLVAGQGWSTIVVGARLQRTASPGWRGARFAGPPVLVALLPPRRTSDWIELRVPGPPDLTDDAELVFQLSHVPAIGAQPLEFGAPISVTVFR